MKHIKTLEDFLKESFIKDQFITNSALIIKAGTKLYHSTIEDFEIEKLSTGGYDKILWTAEDPKISNMYIPASSGTIAATSSSISSVKNYMEDPTIANSLGIFYEIKGDSLLNQGIFQEFSDQCDIHDKSEYELYKKLDKQKEIFNQYKSKSREIYKNEEQYTDEEIEKFDQEFNDVESEKNRLEKLLEQSYQESRDKYNLDKYKNNYVNTKLTELGYSPRYEDKYTLDNTWKLKYSKNGIVPSDYQQEGRMFILTPNRDLKILDKTNGETIEPDLTELDYHRHDWFEYAMKNGYDGIKICDFAQSEIKGNVGHYSIGLFKHVIKDLDKKIVSAKHVSISESESKYIKESLELDISKNMETANDFGSIYGQNVEAKGTYVTVGHFNHKNYLNGKAYLNNPLIIYVNDDTQIEYKRELANKYKAKGSKLTNKLMSMGYDSIVTIYEDDNSYGEIVLFPNANFSLDRI